MKNNRTLFPPLFGDTSTGGGGGGSGNRIQLSELPEASLEYKDKIAQYIGETTETLTNGYFYKCVEHTTTEGDVITVTYSWDNIPVMEAGSSGGADIEVGVETPVYILDGEIVYATLLKNQNPTMPYTTNSILNSTNIKELVKIEYNVLLSGTNTVLGFEKNIQTFGLTATQYYINSNGSGWTYPKIVIYYTKN